LEKELAELGEKAQRQISAAIEVVDPLLIGIRQGRTVFRLPSGQPARDRPQAIGVCLRLGKPGVGEETGDAAISVQKRMNPGQTMVSGRGGDDALTCATNDEFLNHNDERSPNAK